MDTRNRPSPRWGIIEKWRGDGTLDVTKLPVKVLKAIGFEISCTDASSLAPLKSEEKLMISCYGSLYWPEKFQTSTGSLIISRIAEFICGFSLNKKTNATLYYGETELAKWEDVDTVEFVDPLVLCYLARDYRLVFDAKEVEVTINYIRIWTSRSSDLQLFLIGRFLDAPTKTIFNLTPTVKVFFNSGGIYPPLAFSKSLFS